MSSFQGKTEVLVDEARNVVRYVLDENLIDFGSALEEQDYDRCSSAPAGFTMHLLHVLCIGLIKSTS